MQKKKYEEYSGQPCAIAYKNKRWIIKKFGYNSDKLILHIPVIPGFTNTEIVQGAKRQFQLTGVPGFDIFTYRTESNDRIDYYQSEKK